MLPAALGAMAGGAALKAGIGGLTNLGQAEEEKEQARKAALQQLSSRFQASTGGQTFAPTPELPETPGVGEAVVAPMLAAGTDAAVSGALDPGKPGQKEDEWYKSAARGYLGR